MNPLYDEIDRLRKENRKLKTALRRAYKLYSVALPKFNWGASALDAEAITLLNTVPGEIRAALGE